MCDVFLSQQSQRATLRRGRETMKLLENWLHFITKSSTLLRQGWDLAHMVHFMIPLTGTLLLLYYLIWRCRRGRQLSSTVVFHGVLRIMILLIFE